MNTYTSKQIAVISYFLRKSRHNFMLWSIIRDAMKNCDVQENFCEDKNYFYKLLDAFFEEALSLHWDNYLEDFSGVDLYHRKFFKVDLLPKIKKLLDLDERDAFRNQWQSNEFAYKKKVFEEIFKISFHLESKNLHKNPRIRTHPNNFKKLYRSMRKEISFYSPSGYGLYDLSKMKGPLLVLLSGYYFLYSRNAEDLSDNKGYKKTETLGMHDLSLHHVLPIIVFAYSLITIFPFLSNAVMKKVGEKMSAFSNQAAIEVITKNESVNQTTTDDVFLSKLLSILDQFPLAKEKLPKLPAFNKEKTKPSHVTESLITYPEPILNRFKPTSSRQQIKESPSLSLLAEAGLQHIDKSMDYQLNTIKKAPEDSNLERQKAYFAPAYQGRKVYPFGKVFVAEVLRDQVDTQEELNKFTEILEQGVCLYRKKLNKSGLKVYKTSSIAADAILKVIHGQKRVVCSAQRMDVETPTGEILADKVVYVPEIVGPKIKLKIYINK